MDPTLSILYFPAAVLLGALHALEPGHAKTLTAAYLIGIKGTRRDAVLLGLAVAATHSIVVVALCGASLLVGREALADRAGYWLQIASGIVVIGLGTWMLWRRLPRARHQDQTHHHHPPAPVHVMGRLVNGELEIVETPEGERLRLALASSAPTSSFWVDILRQNGLVERLRLTRAPDAEFHFISELAPSEPHEFSAILEVDCGAEHESIPFAMHEPGHDDSHENLDDEAHARAHAATLPDYARRGERPTGLQILAFGAAGGMIPCPASVTVMLLSVSVGQAGWGMLTVLGFSLGLAITLVGVGLLVVAGVNRLGSTRRFGWFSQKAPIISAAVVLLSGVVALALAL